MKRREVSQEREREWPSKLRLQAAVLRALRRLQGVVQSCEANCLADDNAEQLDAVRLRELGEAASLAWLPEV